MIAYKSGSPGVRIKSKGSQLLCPRMRHCRGSPFTQLPYNVVHATIPKHPFPFGRGHAFCPQNQNQKEFHCSCPPSGNPKCYICKIFLNTLTKISYPPPPLPICLVYKGQHIVLSIFNIFCMLTTFSCMFCTHSTHISQRLKGHQYFRRHLLLNSDQNFQTSNMRI